MISKTLRRCLTLFALLALAGCVEPYPLYYAPQPLPPLQPYLGPVVAGPAAPAKRVVRHHYRKRHHRVRCRCTPAS